MFDGLTPGIVISVPLITAFIGYITNWAAVKMIFWPVQFIGIGPIGWQGVIHARNEKFANDIADNVGDVLSARDLVAGFDPAELEAMMSDRLHAVLPELVADVADRLNPGLWDQMHPDAQAMVITQLRNEGTSLAHETFDHLTELSDELLDLRSLVLELLTGENTERLARLFQQLGGKELRFIEIYGGVFGFLVGCFQVLLFGVFGQWWTMPIVGVLVGLGTNWLAIQMIFRPTEPKRFLGLVTYQGMFPKRQAEIAHEYGLATADEIFTPANMLRLITEGETGDRIARIILEKVDARLEQQRLMLEMLAQTPITDQMVDEVKTLVIDRVALELPAMRSELEPWIKEQMGVAAIVEDRMGQMDKEEFERLLRGIFEQDEWILIVLGGVLGGLVGLLQGSVVLALTVD